MFLGLVLFLTPMLLEAKEFHVGSKDGWVVKPSEDYNQWARTHRFRVNDTLRESNSLLILNFTVIYEYYLLLLLLLYTLLITCNVVFILKNVADFKYVKGNDSVLVVKKEDYDSCNINNPKQKLDNGDSKFKLSDSGLYYFISGNVDNCKHDEKMIVQVMAVRPNVTAVPPSQPPASASPPKIPLAYVDTPAPSPSKASSVGVVVWVVLMLFGGYAGFVY